MATPALADVLHYVRCFAQQVQEHTDGQLLERFISQRDEPAFAALLQRHGPLVLRVCRLVYAGEELAKAAGGVLPEPLFASLASRSFMLGSARCRRLGRRVPPRLQTRPDLLRGRKLDGTRRDPPRRLRPVRPVGRRPLDPR
jgi:hypothetical protein